MKPPSRHLLDMLKKQRTERSTAVYGQHPGSRAPSSLPRLAASKSASISSRRQSPRWRRNGGPDRCTRDEASTGTSTSAGGLAWTGMDWHLPELAHPVGQGVVGQLMPAAVAAAGKTAQGQRPDMRLPETDAALGNGRRMVIAGLHRNRWPTMTGQGGEKQMRLF